MKIVYEDNHLIVVYKEPGTLVQGDATGDKPLSEMVKQYLKEKYHKPGNVFCGVVHRLDRPVGGLVIFAKTSKALTRLNEMLRKSEIHKKYWALVEGNRVTEVDTLKHLLVSDGRLNKTFQARPGQRDARECILKYTTLASGRRYSLLEITLITGRKHQIRAQLSLTGTPIKGDLKYGAKRSNADGSISLMAKELRFIHPVSKQEIHLIAPPTPEMQKFIDSVEEQ